MQVIDKTKLQDITFKYPSIMADDAKEKILEKYNEILTLKDQLADDRMRILEMEKVLKEKEKEFRELSTLCSFEFATKQVNQIRNEVSILIVNPNDAARPTYTPGQ